MLMYEYFSGEYNNLNEISTITSFLFLMDECRKPQNHSYIPNVTELKSFYSRIHRISALVD